MKTSIFNCAIIFEYRWSLCALLVTMSLALISTSVLAQSDEQSVEDFVGASYHHGLPVEQAERYGAEAVPVLLSMLKKSEHKAAWPNIVFMLGLLNDESAAEPLIEFLENRFTGEVDNITYRALVAVPGSLGLLSKGSESKAENYLIQGLDLKRWNQDRIKWRYPALGIEQIPLLLTQLSISSVATTGTEKSLQQLEKFKAKLQQESSHSYPTLLPKIDEAIRINKMVKEHGRSALLEVDK